MSVAICSSVNLHFHMTLTVLTTGMLRLLTGKAMVSQRAVRVARQGERVIEEVRRLTEAARGSRPIADRSLVAQDEALATAYRLYIHLRDAPMPERDRALRVLTRDSGGVNPTADAKRVLLKAVRRYGGSDGSKRAMLSRDVKALAYAERCNIRPNEFAERLREGRGVHAWAAEQRKWERSQRQEGEQKARVERTAASTRSMRPAKSLEDVPAGSQNQKPRKWRVRRRAAKDLAGAGGTFVLFAHVSPGGGEINVRRAHRLGFATLADRELDDLVLFASKAKDGARADDKASASQSDIRHRRHSSLYT